ncbi:hypothetical protein PRIPAC_88068, partial [Pristionchus pacificus]
VADMARAERAPSQDMKKALLHWFNTVGSGGCGGQKVDEMSDLWREHLPALLLYLKGGCQKLNGVRGESAIQVYEEAMTYMKSCPESECMAASLNSSRAANGSELEISKFLLLFWHELCISDSKIIEGSIQFLEQVNLQHTMGKAIEWMNRATENQDYNRWFNVLFECPEDEEIEENEDMEEARTPVDAGDARTPTESFDKSIERKGEDTFTFTTPSNIPMRHSFYERDVLSMRNSLMVTPRLSARRQLPVPNSEPRPFMVPHSVTRGSPITEQLNSPAMREKRREREMRALQQKLSQAQEDRDAKEIEVKKLSHNVQQLYESNRQLKEKVSDHIRELAKESKDREEAENETEELRKEKTSLIEIVDELSNQIKKWKHDYELWIVETSRLTERNKELDHKVNIKSRELADIKDEMRAGANALMETRESEQKEKKKVEELRQKVIYMNDNLEEMKEDWRRRLKEKENEIIEIECSNHSKIGEMNELVMRKEAEMKALMDEMEMERMKGVQLKDNFETEMKMMKEDVENVRSKMMDEMKEKTMKLDQLEADREKIDKESIEKAREMTKKMNELEMKTIEMESNNISLKQRLSVSSSNVERLTQEVEDLTKKNEVVNGANDQLKETIGEMEEQIRIRERELNRLKEVDEMNRTMKDKIDKLMKENEEAKEKAYTAMLENDKFTAIIEKMRREYEERMNERDWNDTCLRSEITTANKDKDHAEESLRNVMKEREGEKMKNEETINELTTKVDNAEKELCNLQFVHKNEMKKIKVLESELKKNGEAKKQNEEMKESMDRLKRELENERETGKENMESVVSKKKELEIELVKKEKIIDKLTEENARLKEHVKELTVNDTSMTTVRDDMRGTLLPQRTLMDFDEEPTQLEAKSNLSRMKEKEKDKETEYTEVMNTKNERMMEDKENDKTDTKLPPNDRRQLPPTDSKSRIKEIAERNAKTMPHLRSSHAVEQMSPNFSQEGLKDGIVRPSSTKKLSMLRNKLNIGKK